MRFKGKKLPNLYNLDINFIDSKDGLNLLDYVNGMIDIEKKTLSKTNVIKVYEEYKTHIIDLVGKSNKK